MASYHDVCFHCWGHFQQRGRGMPLPDEYSSRLKGDGPGSSSYTRPPDNIQLHAVPYDYRCDSGEGLWRCLRHTAMLLTSQWYTFLRIDLKWPSWIRTLGKKVFLQQGKNVYLCISESLWKHIQMPWEGRRKSRTVQECLEVGVLPPVPFHVVAYTAS